MPHPIWGPPAHRLESVRATLVLPHTDNGDTTTLVVHGDCSTSRASLWTYSEAWRALDRDGVLQPTDTLHWLALAVAQDRPITQEGLQRCLLPGGYEDVPLPL